MAVEKSKVIARLKALFPKANLSQKRLDAIADKLAKKPADDADETAIDAVINDFNDVMSIEEIAKEDDRVRTLEAEKKKAEEVAKKKAGKSEEEEGEEVIEVDKDAPEWAKALIAQNKKLTSELEAIKSGKTLETKQQTAAKLFESSEVLKKLKPEHKENWLKRIDLNSEIPFEEQISALETEYTDLVQVTADNGLYPGPAGGGNPSKETDESLVDDILGIEK